MKHVIGSEVRDMFARISHRYDLANTVLSVGMHHLWKRGLVKEVPQGDALLDIATGTGDLLLPLSKKFRTVTGLDFCKEMLEAGREQKGFDNYPAISLVHGNALDLPFENDKFDAITVAFGVRNFEDLEKGLREMRRVLRPDGTLHILEFGTPSSVFIRTPYNIYSKHVLPFVGGVLTGDKAAYSYLQETSSVFPCGEQFVAIMQKAGFETAAYKPVQFGIAYRYTITDSLK